MSNGKVPLEDVARRILNDAATQQRLSEPIDPGHLLPNYVAPGELEQTLIKTKILQRCRDIARAIASVLELEGVSQPPHSELIATAHTRLNEGAPSTDKGRDVAHGIIDRLTKTFEMLWEKGQKILTATMNPHKMEGFVFDLRYQMPADHSSLTLDLEGLLKAMAGHDGLYHELERLWHAHDATELHLKFEERERKLRDCKARQGLRVSEIYSCTKLLHIDAKKIETLLEQDPCTINPEQLLRQLLIHYEQTLYLQAHPAGTSMGGLLSMEHGEPGCFGASYPERIQKVLDTYRNTIAVLHALRRTLRLLRCRDQDTL